MIEEYHTSDLTSPCLRMVQLRHSGKATPETPGAMYRGLLFGEAVRYFHETDDWENSHGAIEIASMAIDKQLLEEGRVYSQGVGDNIEQHLEDVRAFVAMYSDRFAGYFQEHCEFIGCELPIRWTVPVDGEEIEFASHLDMMFRGPHPYRTDSAQRLWVWDWKLREKSPSPHYIGRNMQLGMYGLAVTHGAVKVGNGWYCYGEQPTVGWLHANYLKPYARKVTATDDEGRKREFVRGDPRPMTAILRELNISDEAAILDEFSLRVRMARAGHWPTNPDPEGCRYCGVSHACPSWDYHGQPEQ